MVKTFYRFLIEITIRRVEEIQNDIAENNRKYKEFTREIIKILAVIDKGLPVECHKVLEALEDTRGKRDSLVEEMLYRQGLIDGIKLSNVHSKLRDKAIRKIEPML